MKRILAIRMGIPLATLALVTFGCSDDPAGPPPPSQLSDTYVKISIVALVADVSDDEGYLGGSIQPGSTISGTYIYDATTPDRSGASTVGSYPHTESPYGILLQAGGWTFETDPDNVDFLVQVIDGNTGRDNYLLRSYNNLALNDTVTVEHISWQLDDVTATAVDSDTLTSLPPVIADYESLFGLNIDGEHTGGDGDYSIRAHVTSVRRVPYTPY